MRHLLPASLAALALVVTGCSSEKTGNDHYPAIHIEPSDEGSWGTREIVMPQTGLHFMILGRPIVPDGNFMATEVYEVGPPDMRRNILLVQIDNKAADLLYRLSSKAAGKRLFLLVNGRAVGVHPIAEAVGNNIMFDVEVPGATKAEKTKAIFALRDELNETILKVRKEKADK